MKEETKENLKEDIRLLMLFLAGFIAIFGGHLLELWLM